MNKEIMKSFVECIEKIAFGFSPPVQNQQPHKSFGQQVGTIARHPISFAGHLLGGEAAGAAAGMAGGAFVYAPVAAALASKRFRPAEETFGKTFKSQMFKGTVGEGVGGAILGMGAGGNKFFNKYKNENQNNV